MSRRLLIALLFAFSLPAAGTALAAGRPAHPVAHAVRHRPSARGAVVPAAGTVYIRGGGYGHGIGMSQYGALGYAEHGADYRTILAHYYSGTAIGFLDPNTTVRVLLKSGGAAFSGVARIGGTKLDPAATYSVQAQHDGTLAILGGDGKPVGPHWEAPLAVAGDGALSVAGLGLYRGALEFRPDGHGGVQTVDAVGLDDYVRGVVAAESPSSWPAAALEAQAVAARTYALTTTVAGNGYSLYADTRSQMYGGVGAETPSSDAAVAATRGQIVTFAGHPAVTLFSSSSGGYTASIQDAWPGATPEPWLRAVPDPYDSAGGNPHHLWTQSLSLAAAAGRLGALVKGSLLGIRILRHGDSPRILLAEVVGTEGTAQVSGSSLQSDFGLPTTLAAFLTITTRAWMPPAATGGTALPAAVRAAWLPSRLAITALNALGPAARRAADPKRHGLEGTVVPAHAGDSVVVARQSGTAWRTVTTAKVRSDGTFTASLPTAGTYRAVWNGLDGPSVRIP